MSLERRGGGKGPGFGVSYTLAKAIRDVEGFLFLAQDQLNPAAEKSLASNNRTHQVVARMNWMAPGKVQLAGIVRYRSGSPWNVTTGRDSNGGNEQNDRPDLVNPSGDRYDRDHTYYGDFTGRVGNLGVTPILARHSRRSTCAYVESVRGQRLRFEGSSRRSRDHKVNFASPQGNLRSALFGTSTGDSGQSAAGRTRLPR